MILFADKLTKDYDGFRALDQLGLEIRRGEVFGLLGPNGSGKTTALRLMLGFLRPSSGRALIAGHDCWHQGVHARRHVSYLPGELRLYENMTGRQLLRFLGRLRGLPAGQEIDRPARAFDIDLNRPIAHLSSGMKRKLALLLVLLPRSPLLILDEPTNTLDPTMRALLLQQLQEASRNGQAVLFSSHVLQEVEKICDRVGILQRGQLVHLQKMSELKEIHYIRATFAQPVPLPPVLQGVRRLERQGNQIVLEYAGSLSPLLAWLAHQGMLNVHLEPLGLAAMYHHYHGAEE